LLSSTHRRVSRCLPAQQHRVGIGTAHAHHGELLQGAFSHGDGIVHALVTLPYPALGSRVEFHPTAGAEVELPGPGYEKVGRAVELTLRTLSDEPRGGRVVVTSDIPRGLGMGSSTSDVTAAIRAVADSRGTVLSEEEVARLATLAEVACDSIMITDRVVLFAHRAGAVVETFPAALPRLVVLGCDTDPGNPVDTLAHAPARYDDHELAVFRILRGALRRALEIGDVGLLGRVATASARINQRHLPNRALDLLLDIAAQVGAAGVQVAHSGTVAGLIFDPARPGWPSRVSRARARMRAAGLSPTGVLDA
jgi:uncharacterized protein involved in propanediol utilization